MISSINPSIFSKVASDVEGISWSFGAVNTGSGSSKDQPQVGGAAPAPSKGVSEATWSKVREARQAAKSSTEKGKKVWEKVPATTEEAAAAKLQLKKALQVD